MKPKTIRNKISQNSILNKSMTSSRVLTCINFVLPAHKAPTSSILYFLIIKLERETALIMSKSKLIRQNKTRPWLISKSYLNMKFFLINFEYNSVRVLSLVLGFI
jgi:hypothetical protein